MTDEQWEALPEEERLRLLFPPVELSEYERVASAMLGEDMEYAPLWLPGEERQPNVADLSDSADQALACLSGISPADWAAMNADKRLFWMRRYLARLGSRADTPDEQLVAATDPPFPPPNNPPHHPHLALGDGGFTLGGRLHRLSGRPLQMLEVLLKSKHHSASADRLREEMGLNDEYLSFPEQAVKDAAKHLRDAIRKAAKAVMVACPKDPVPHTGKGKQLSYRLADLG